MVKSLVIIIYRIFALVTSILLLVVLNCNPAAASSTTTGHTTISTVDDVSLLIELFDLTHSQATILKNFATSLEELSIIENQPPSFRAFVDAENNNPYNLYMIWFSGYYKMLDKPIIIGGNDLKRIFYYDLLTCLEIMQKFLKKSTIDLYVDQQTYDDNQNKLDWLKNKYPQFKLYFLEDHIALLDEAINLQKISFNEEKYKMGFYKYVKSLMDKGRYFSIKAIKSLLEHGMMGNPAIASDALRVFNLENDKFSIYLDVDDICFWGEEDDIKFWKSMIDLIDSKFAEETFKTNWHNLTYLFRYTNHIHSYEKPSLAYAFNQQDNYSLSSKVIAYHMNEEQITFLKNTYIQYLESWYVPQLEIFKHFTKKYDPKIFDSYDMYFPPPILIVNSTGPGFYCTPFNYCQTLTKINFPYVKVDPDLRNPLEGVLSWSSRGFYAISYLMEVSGFKPYTRLTYLLFLYDFQSHNPQRFYDSLIVIGLDISAWFKKYGQTNPAEIQKAIELLKTHYTPEHFNELNKFINYNSTLPGK